MPKTKGAAPSCRPCAHAHASLRCQWSTIDQQARLSANSATAIVPLIDAANIRAIMVSVVSKAWTACGCPMWFEFCGRSFKRALTKIDGVGVPDFRGESGEPSGGVARQPGDGRSRHEHPPK